MARSLILLSIFLVAGLICCGAQVAPSPDWWPTTCGESGAAFQVKKDPASQFQPEASKAAVYFIEAESGTGTATTTRIGIDGKWAGATQGHSWFGFALATGEHHLCADTHIPDSRWRRNGGTALAHWTAEAGATYYFEVRVLTFPDTADVDVELFPLDSDEGRYLISKYPYSSAHVKGH